MILAAADKKSFKFQGPSFKFRKKHENANPSGVKYL